MHLTNAVLVTLSTLGAAVQADPTTLDGRGFGSVLPRPCNSLPGGHTRCVDGKETCYYKVFGGDKVEKEMSMPTWKVCDPTQKRDVSDDNDSSLADVHEEADGSDDDEGMTTTPLEARAPAPRRPRLTMTTRHRMSCHRTPSGIKCTRKRGLSSEGDDNEGSLADPQEEADGGDDGEAAETTTTLLEARGSPRLVSRPARRPSWRQSWRPSKCITCGMGLPRQPSLGIKPLPRSPSSSSSSGSAQVGGVTKRGDDDDDNDSSRADAYEEVETMTPLEARARMPRRLIVRPGLGLRLPIKRPNRRPLCFGIGCDTVR